MTPSGKHLAPAILAAAFAASASSTDAKASSAATQPQQQQGNTLVLQPGGNTILVTGGGSGIGRELALRFHAAGNTVIVAGRSIGPLQELAQDHERMHAMTLDVTDPASIREFSARIVAEHPSLNVLVNNAGIMRFEDTSSARNLDDAEAQVSTNLLGPIRLTDALVDHLKTQRSPVIVNVSSGLAFVPRADASTYSATKAAIHSYTQSLRAQLAGQVKVIELVPPAVQTELTPGQSTREGYMPLDAFIDEVLALLATQPTPDEIIVERAKFQRHAEREGRFDAAFERINGTH